MIFAKVIKSGIFTTIQDAGRSGLKRWGLSDGGAMDMSAFMRANLSLGNVPSSAVLEIYGQGPNIEIFASTTLSCIGVNTEVLVNNKAVISPFTVQEGDLVSFKVLEGNCGYIAVKGGFSNELYLGSTAYHYGLKNSSAIITNNSFLQKFDGNQNEKHSAKLKTPDYEKNIRVYPGPESRLFSTSQLEQTLHSLAVSADFNRMAYPLENATPVPHHFKIASSGIIPGMIQLTPSGEMYVLGRDCQTTGGYPRIWTIHPDDLNVFYQKRPGDRFDFEVVDLQ